MFLSRILISRSVIVVVISVRVHLLCEYIFNDLWIRAVTNINFALTSPTNLKGKKRALDDSEPDHDRTKRPHVEWVYKWSVTGYRILAQAWYRDRFTFVSIFSTIILDFVRVIDIRNTGFIIMNTMINIHQVKIRVREYMFSDHLWLLLRISASQNSSWWSTWTC